MAKPKKTPRPKAETPKGFRDYFGAEVAERDNMLDAITEVYHRYGFDPLERLFKVRCEFTFCQRVSEEVA